ncbi:hypothetical protein Tco_0238713 [Tanacetum coccineum]
MMDKDKTFKRRSKHKALYDALVASLIVDKDDMDRDDTDNDPSASANKEPKKKQKNCDSSNKEKDQADISKKDKSSSKPSQSTKPVDADEGIQDVETITEDAGLNSTPSAHVINKPTWFKDSPRPETLDSPDPIWSKEPSADEGPEQTWFIDLEKNAKDLADFDDILGTTFYFSNFVKHRFQKDTLTKADLEGPVYQLLKGTCRSFIELEYHLEQRYLTFFEQLDWINHEGDNTPKDFSNPLPLVGAPNHLYIQATYFFNKDLKCLRTENLEEKKYSASTIKTRAIRYELYRVEEMVENL